MEEITIYTTPACPWCNKVKNLLQEKGVNFKEIDVANNPDGAKEMLELTGQRGVPVTVIGEDVIVGFNRSEFERLL